MKEIKLLKTSQIMLFPSDDIDFHGISRNINIKSLDELFSLKYVQIPSNITVQLPQIIFQNGEFSYNKKTYLIEHLIIDERKISISILAPSNISDIFYSKLKKILISFDTREEKGNYDSLITTYETTCIVKLDFDFNKLLKNSVLENFNKTISEKVNNFNSKITVIPSSVRFQINYSDIPEKLKKNKISIADKHLLIEQREKTDPTDKIYFTVSPTDTETHFELLKQIEKLVKVRENDITSPR